MIRLFVFAAALCAASSVYAECPHDGTICESDGQIIARAIDRQTDAIRADNTRRDFELWRQTEALDRMDDSIKLQSLMDERPFH